MGDTLSQAKAVLQGAKNYTKGVEGQEPSRFAPKPVGQHADAPYKMARSATPAKDTTDLGAELRAKSENVKQYEDATK